MACSPYPSSCVACVPILGADWEALGDGTLGEFDHRLILDNFLRGVDPDRGTLASSGWTGDQSGVHRRRDASGAPLGDIAVVLKTRWATAADADAWAQAYADSVGLRFADPQRYAGRTDQLVRTDPGPGADRLGDAGERAIALQWTRQFSAIAIAPDPGPRSPACGIRSAGQQSVGRGGRRAPLVSPGAPLP